MVFMIKNLLPSPRGELDIICNNNNNNHYLPPPSPKIYEFTVNAFILNTRTSPSV